MNSAEHYQKAEQLLGLARSAYSAERQAANSYNAWVHLEMARFEREREQAYTVDYPYGR